MGFVDTIFDVIQMGLTAYGGYLALMGITKYGGAKADGDGPGMNRAGGQILGGALIIIATFFLLPELRAMLTI